MANDENSIQGFIGIIAGVLITTLIAAGLYTFYLSSQPVANPATEVEKSIEKH